MARFEEYYHGSLERLRQLYDQEILTSWQIEHVEKHIHAMKESYETEIASLQEAAAEKDSVIEAQSEELGKARRGLEDMRQICNIPPSKYAEISQAQLVMIVGEMLKAIDETYKRYAPQWEVAEVETAE